MGVGGRALSDIAHAVEDLELAPVLGLTPEDWAAASRTITLLLLMLEAAD